MQSPFHDSCPAGCPLRAQVESSPGLLRLLQISVFLDDHYLSAISDELAQEARLHPEILRRPAPPPINGSPSPDSMGPEPPPPDSEGPAQ